MASWENYRAVGTPAVAPRNSHVCEHCKRPLIALFTSMSCNHCDNPPLGYFYRGYVAFRVSREAFNYYVFYTCKEAEAWGAQLYEAHEIRVVLKPTPFLWVGANNGIVAETTHKIMPDHRFEPGEHRSQVFLAPKSVPLDCAERVFL